MLVQCSVSLVYPFILYRFSLILDNAQFKLKIIRSISSMLMPLSH